ncbi:Uncharacterised protein [Mycobacterium tuberculosis]|nr:Uncharacterised protein [Mycobacterium tuberculosis]
MRFRKGEERIGHEILRVARREVAGERVEQIELSALRDWAMSRCHWEGARSVQRAWRPVYALGNGA